MCASVLQDTFTEWVAKKVDERNQKIVTTKGLNIEMDAEITAIFHSSTKTSGKVQNHFIPFDLV